ncbi:MAG: DNA/RNA non-specific endonuclease [Jiangellaceae bacterium]|nr:DNA/RNA non-specific endonuclease [Jiangellaceae bacterium]
MGRLDALQNINRDATLKEEIFTRLAEREVVDRAELAGARPSRASVDAARALIEDPPERPLDPGLEAIILVLGRPVLLVQHDDFDVATLDTDTWRSRLEPARAALRSAISSVGRIEVDNSPRFDWVGTGWVVADDVVVTNRHVAAEFARREGDGFVFRSSFLGEMAARVDFKEEFQGPNPAEFRIAEVLHIEDDGGPDMAFLRVAWSDGDADAPRAPIRLADGVQPGGGIAVIGYPAKDTRTRIPDEMDRIFGNVYDVKRLAPGETTAVHTGEQLVTHDATTLGGNSGSVVVDLETGSATALHFAGRERDRNFAVPAPVVRARLASVLGMRQARRAPVMGPSRPVVTVADLAGRTGYDPGFLGPLVTHPALRPGLADALAPVDGRDDGLLDYSHFSVRMHRDRRLAMYTAVNIDGASARNVRRARDKWAMDPRLDERFQVGNELYERNRLDRGHLVRRLDPAWGDTFGVAEAAAMDTFFYTNCSPQHETLNQQLWLGVEDYILTNADVHDLKVSVFSGPIFRDSDRRYRDFLVPEDYWKVVAVVDDQFGELSVTGYVVSQRDFMDDLEFVFGPYQTYQVSVATIEGQTQLDFGDLKSFDPLGRVEAAPVRRLTTLSDIVL